MMRLQLARPDNNLLKPDLYNQLFSVHGSTMMFLFAVPVMLAFGLYFVPMMVGTRNVAFPRLNLYGYYVYLGGCLFLYAGFALNIGVDTGWFSYVPLSGPAYSPGKRVDIWAQMITMTEISALDCADPDHRYGIQDARAGNDFESGAAVRLVDGRHLVHGDLRYAFGDDGEHAFSNGAPDRARISSTTLRVAIHCCGSIFSGSSVIPRCTSFSFRHWVCCRT